MPIGKARSSRRPRRRTLARWAIIVLLAFVLALAGVQMRVRWVARGRIVERIEEVPHRSVAVVFGASVYGRRLSPTLLRRVDLAVDLHRAGRVDRILVSGDNSSSHYNESDAMRRHALSRGVAEDNVVSDFAGFSTYETLYRARELFGVRRPVLVSQGYHLPRAMYIALGLGLDPVGVAADAPGPSGRGLMSLREALASVKAFVQVEITRPLPTYLGPEEADLEAPPEERTAPP
jgi:vancomycin permeability regulator SanA